MITAPGIYEIDEAEYHADPCPAPSLSHSIAKLLLDRTPMHAKAAHPRLTPQPEHDAPTSAMDVGSALHKLLLGRGQDIAVLNYPDYRKNEAKEARDAARAARKIPILAEAYDDIRACATAALEQMRAHPDLAAFFAPGISEAVLAWQEGDTWCRGMADRLPNDPRAPIFDIKTTALSAAPESWERRLIHEYATQAAFYQRGRRAITGKPPAGMLFVVIETDVPYGVSVITPALSLLAYADAEIERAIAEWSACMKSGVWPGYPPFTAHVELPGYLALRSEEREIRREIMRETYDPHNAFAQELIP